MFKDARLLVFGFSLTKLTNILQALAHSFLKMFDDYSVCWVNSIPVEFD